jgi:ubiquinone/menaquinone biosynthesis C-methylase UbiE
MNYFRGASRTKFIGYSFFFYMGALYCGVNLYLNDKLRAEMKQLEDEDRKKEYIIDLNDRIAHNYEKKTENFEFRNQFNKYRRVLISYAKGNVLELGIGTGRSLEFYKQDTKIIGIDFSPKMLEIAEDKLKNRDDFNIPQEIDIKLMLMDCENLKFEDNSFDTVVDINNFQCYYDYEKVLKNIKKVLKDNGIFIFLAKGESDFLIIRDFYKLFKPFVFMKFGQNLAINWKEIFEADKDFEILFKDRKNYGRTYIYVLKLHKNENKNNINKN